MGWIFGRFGQNFWSSAEGKPPSDPCQNGSRMSPEDARTKKKAGTISGAGFAGSSAVAQTARQLRGSRYFAVRSQGDRITVVATRAG